MSHADNPQHIVNSRLSVLRYAKVLDEIDLPCKCADFGSTGGASISYEQNIKISSFAW